MTPVRPLFVCCYCLGFLRALSPLCCGLGKASSKRTLEQRSKTNGGLTCIVMCEALTQQRNRSIIIHDALVMSTAPSLCPFVMRVNAIRGMEQWSPPFNTRFCLVSLVMRFYELAHEMCTEVLLGHLLC